MGGYEYSNARLRAMKSRLLTRQDFQTLAEARTVDNLLTALARTDYQDALEQTLVRFGELGAIQAALSLDLRRIMRRMRSFFEEPESSVIAAVLRTYDVHNIKAALRGAHNHATPDSIRDAQLPVGDLSEALLAELNQAPDVRTVIDLMASLGLALAHPLLEARASQTPVEVPALELALDRWYFAEMADVVSRAPRGAEHLRDALALDADLVNLLTVLRLAHVPAERPLYLSRLGIDDLHMVFVGPGNLPVSLLEQAAAQDSIDGVVTLLARTRYGEALAAGQDAYRQSGRLSDLERSLRRYRLQFHQGLMSKDPLGIGVPLGYLALKTGEIGNLRWVACGLDAGLSPASIMGGLELAA